MNCLAICALDFFEGCTVPLTKWLAEGPLDRHELYIRACAAYAKHEHADFELRMQPHVAYNVFNDQPYFIFKQDNNGTCLVVGETLPAFSERDVL